MAYNPQKIKRWFAFAMSGIVPLSLFSLLLIGTNDLVLSLSGGIGSIILMVAIGNLLTRNPFTPVLEAQGYLALNISSMGGIIPFVLKPVKNKVKGLFGGDNIEHMMDREAMMYLDKPKSGEIYEDDDKIIIHLYKKDLNTSYFAFNGIPTFIYNSQLGTFMTKEMLSKLETDTFARHEIMYMNQIAKELNGHMLNFGRYVIELTRPASNLLDNPIVKWVLLFILLIIGGILFGPTILQGAEGIAGASSPLTQPLVSPAG